MQLYFVENKLIEQQGQKQRSNNCNWKLWEKIHGIHEVSNQHEPNTSKIQALAYILEMIKQFSSHID